jgi:hypothetical protein
MAFDIKSILVNPMRTLIVSIRQTIDTAIHIFDVIRSTIEDAIAIYEEIKTFDIDPKWKIRVLSAPEAIDGIKKIAQAPSRIFIAVRDLVNRVKNSIDAFKNPVAEAEAAAEEAGALEGGLLRIFPRLAALLGRAITRILAVAGLIVQLIIDVDNAVADIHTIVQNLRGTLEDLNHLNVVFLKQTNPRRTVILEDGTKMKLRVGHLHRLS